MLTDTERAAAAASPVARVQQATTQDLTRSHLAQARAALTGSQAAAAPTLGGLQTAARHVAEAAALNVGTGLQVGAERAFIAPSLLGADLDIAGNGDELLYTPERYEPQG